MAKAIRAIITNADDTVWGVYSDLRKHYKSNAELLREAMRALYAEKRNKKRP